MIAGKAEKISWPSFEDLPRNGVVQATDRWHPLTTPDASFWRILTVQCSLKFGQNEDEFHPNGWISSQSSLDSPSLPLSGGSALFSGIMPLTLTSIRSSLAEFRSPTAVALRLECVPSRSLEGTVNFLQGFSWRSLFCAESFVLSFAILRFFFFGACELRKFDSLRILVEHRLKNFLKYVNSCVMEVVVCAPCL